MKWLWRLIPHACVHPESIHVRLPDDEAENELLRLAPGEYLLLAYDGLRILKPCRRCGR